MSTRNPTGWTKIRDTVKDAQDILTAGCRHSAYRWNYSLWEHSGRYSGHPTHLNIIYPICPPQTLGGLCLEIAEDKLLKYKVHADETDLIRTHRERIGVFGIKETKWFPRTEIDDIRRAMYHKNTDPEKEKRTQKAEKLIIMVGKEMGLYGDLR